MPSTVAGLAAASLLCTAAAAFSAETTAEEWQEVRRVDGIVVEARPTESGFNEHRAHGRVCADVESLAGFVADSATLPEWIPHTEEVRVLQQRSNEEIYYLRSATPWPMRSRDMIYRLQRHTDSKTATARLSITGLPDYLPPEPDAVRMKAARGTWTIHDQGDAISITFKMFVHPGSAPRFIANRRMAGSVGQTVANLAERFPCGDRTGP